MISSGDNMKRKDLLIKMLAISMMFLLISSIASVSAQGDDDDDDDDNEPEHNDSEEHEPDYERDEDGTVWIQTDIMTVKLDSEYPKYQFWYTPDENGSITKFQVKYTMLVEFEDSNGDGVYQFNETIAFVPLTIFDWTLQVGSITDDQGQNTEVYASYTKGALLDEWDDDWFDEWLPDSFNDMGLDLADGDDDDDNSTDDDHHDTQALNFTQYESMTVQFYGHIYLTDYNGTVSDEEGVQANYTIDGGMEFKIDIEIGNFPFLSNTSKIAILNSLDEDLSEEDHKIRLHESDEDEEHDSDEEWDDDLGVEFDESDDDEIEELSFVDSSNNVTRGFYRWLDKAVMTLPNNSQIVVDVAASYWVDDSELYLFLAYPNFDGGSLIHDPSVKLLESAIPEVAQSWSPTLSNGVLIASGIIALAAIVVVLKRR